MSDVGLGATLQLDIQAALNRINDLGNQIDRELSGVQVTVDTSGIGSAISAAVAAADTNVDVEAQAGQVTGAIDSAVDAADTSVDVDAQAGQVTGAIDAAVDAADTDVEVTGEARAVTGAIDSAIDAADSEVTVTGDARQVTGSVDAALDAADTEVTVTGQVEGITGGIEAAIDAADTEVTVTGQISPGLRSEAQGLKEDLDDAAAAGTNLGTVLKGLGAAAAVKGLFDLAVAASDLEQAVGGTEAIFGEASGAINEFATGAARSAGLTETAARTMTSQIGGLLRGFQFTREEAAKTSIQLARLGADLAAAFGGNPEEAVAALGAALRGEFDPLERFGVSLNVASIEAFALANGLAASKDEVTGAVRAQAALQLIMERTADVQGQFAREAETAGGAMAIFKASAGDAAAELGGDLTPAFVGLLGTLQEILPDLIEAGHTILPAVGDAFANLTPLIGTTTQLLVALSPAIGAIASIIAAVPADLIAVAAGFAAFNRVMGVASPLIRTVAGSIGTLVSGIQGIAATRGVSSAAAGMGALRSSLASLNPLVVAGAVAMFGLVDRMNRAAQRAAALRKINQEMTDSFKNANGEIELTARSLARFFEETESGQGASEFFGQFGLTVKDMTGYLLDGEEGFARFKREMDLSGITADLVGEAYQSLSSQMEAVSRVQLRVAVDSGALTQRQVDQAIASEGLIGAYQSLSEKIRDHERHVDDLKKKYDPIAETFADARAQLEQLGDTNQGVASSIGHLLAGTQDLDGSLLNLALQLNSAELSEQEMGAAAALLGTDLETLQGFVEDVNDAIGNFVDTATGSLPTVGDAFKNVGEDGKLSIGEFIEALESSTAGMEQFLADITALTNAGFAELAGEIAQQGPEIGGTLARSLAQALEDGNVEIVEQTNATLQEFQRQWEFNANYLTTVLGPQFVLQAGLLGSMTSDAFGKDLDLAERFRIAGELAAQELPAANASVVAIAALEGGKAAEAYGVNVLRLPADTVAAMIKIGEAIRAGEAPTAAGETGTAVRDQMAGPVAELPGLFGQELAAVAAVINENNPTIAGEGEGVGTATRDGAYQPVTELPGLFGQELAAVAAVINGSVPEIGTAGEEVGKAGREGIDSELSPTEDDTSSTLDRTITAVRETARRMQEAGEAVGEAGRWGTDNFLSRMIEESRRTASDSASAAKGTEHEWRSAGGVLGDTLMGNLGNVLGNSAVVSVALIATLVAAQVRTEPTAASAGRGIGESFGQGIVNGIDGYVGRIASSAARAVREAEAAARREARSQSPSKLFADLGRDLGAGVEQGLSASAAAVADQAARLIRAADDSARSAVGDPMSFVVAEAEAITRRAAAMVPAGGSRDGDGGVSWTGDLVVNYSGPATPEAGRALGVAAADAFQAQLARRRALSSALRAEGR